MKTTCIKYGFLLIAVLSLTCCAKSDELQSGILEVESVKEIPSYILPKSVITGESIPDDEAAKGIGLFLTETDEDRSPYSGSGNGYTNVKYDYNVYRQNWTSGSPIRLKEEMGYLYGYFPYDGSSSDLRAVPVESSLGGSDYLYAEEQLVNIREKLKINITMKHALARLHLTIKKSADYNGEGILSKITLKSEALDSNGKLNLTSGVITASKAQGETGVVEFETDGKSIPETGSLYDILLVPADNADGKKAVEIILSIDGEQIGVNLKDENGFTIQSGKQYNATLVLSGSGIGAAAAILTTETEEGPINF